MDESIYLHDFTIASKDCSERQTIKLPSLMDYMQEAAWANASALHFSTIDLLKDGLTWVMNRMKIDIKRMPHHHEQITIETWPSNIDKYYTHRDFRVYGKDKEVIVEVKSHWLVMDINERKLIAIPDNIKNAGFVVDRKNIADVSGKIRFKEDLVEKQVNIGVSWFDLDINNHVNNTKYCQWLLDSMDGDFLSNNELTEIDIIFKQEGKLGDSFFSKTYYAEEEQKYYHALVHSENGQVHVLAKTAFTSV